MHVDVGNARARSLHEAAHSATVALAVLVLDFPDVDSLTFTFNNASVTIRPTDSTQTVIARYWDQFVVDE